MSRTINAKRFSKVMRDMAKVPSQAATLVARDISREIQKNFSRGVDPYGKSWQPKPNGKKSTLTKTGAGRASIVVRATAGAGIEIVIGLLRMVYHQFGGMSHLKGPSGTSADRKKNKNFGRDKDRSSKRNKPPRRSFLPFEIMPPTWAKIWQKRLNEVAKKAMDRG